MKIIENDNQTRLIVQKDYCDSERENNLIFELANSIELDFYYADEVSGGWEECFALYNANSGFLFFIYSSQIQEYAEGKPVELFGRELEDDDKEWLAELEVI